jgi:hypothetical protein
LARILPGVESVQAVHNLRDGIVLFSSSADSEVSGSAAIGNGGVGITVGA